MTLHLRPGTTVYDSNDAPVVLEKGIGKGGEGSVWSIQSDPSKVAKFYHTGLVPEQVRKLQAMCRLTSDDVLKIAAWPTAVLKAQRSGAPAGLLMRRINGYQEAHLLYSPKSRRTNFPEAQFPFILHSATNVARAFAAIHDAGQVIGDVNHGNLLVSSNGTVALIDCDSFQITDHMGVYPCLVGVPTYTPPELQGQNFQGIRRTTQHDAFGLAVLIFHMLFLGRHPFSGIYRNGTADITIEQAIAEYRFAYLPDNSSTQMQPPPSAPRLSDVPPFVAALFISAFTRSGTPASRPSAHEWIRSLERAAEGVKLCSANPTHHFFNHLSVCPWCRVEGMVGIPMFGIKITVVRDEQFNIAALWMQIEAIQPAQKSIAPPTSQAFRSGCSVHVSIAPVVTNRTRKRLASTAVISLAILIVASTQLEPIVSVAILVAALLGAGKLWQQGNIVTKSFETGYDNARRDYSAAMEEWNTLNNIPAAFSAAKRHLADAKAAFEKLPSERAQKLTELNAGFRQKQLQRYLESHRIEDAVLQNIGRARKQLLRVYNIEDAFDVEHSRIANIKGFGPAMRATLLAWRASVEQQFRFDLNKGADPQDLRELEQALQLKRAESIRVLMGGPNQLRRAMQQWETQTSNSLSKVTDSANRLAQAEVNRNALGGWRWRLEHLGIAVVMALVWVLFIVWPRKIPVQLPMEQRFDRAGPKSAYPDPARTPGFANSGVTQSDIATTICNPAWVASTRPAESYTRKLKQQQLREWGLPGSPTDYEEDHLISLDLGGSLTDARNLWPEQYGPKPGAREKNVVERYLHAQVCSGKMTLEDAQTAIVTDWYRIYFLIARE